MIPSKEGPEVIVLLVGYPEKDYQAENAIESSQDLPALSFLLWGKHSISIDNFNSVMLLAKSKGAKRDHHEPSWNLKGNRIGIPSGLNLEFLGFFRRYFLSAAIQDC